MSHFRSVLLLGSALLLCACGRAEAPEVAAPADEAMPAQTMPAEAMPGPVAETTTEAAPVANATLAAVGDSGVGGQLEFSAMEGAVHVTGTLTGLKPGATHAFHVHEFGDCSAADASSAGGHFNPDAQPHGDRATGNAHHAGDIPNQVVGDDGQAVVDQHLAGLEIGTGGANDIVGKGVIVHANADDYTTQPTGNAGGRIACGVITLDGAAPAADAAPMADTTPEADAS